MKTFRSKSGPFSEQPYYEPAEVESMCTQELRRAQLYPAEPGPIRIDRFIEKRFGVQPTYEDLPPGLLGFTRFGAGGVEQIVVTKTLDDQGTEVAERRLRTTLAHEGGHGLLHAHLFALDAQPRSLFGDGLAPDAPKVLCRDDGVMGVGAPTRKPPYRWWEYQANQAMGALLLPRGLVQKALAPVLVVQGKLGMPELPTARREEAARMLADVFDVNPVVARIRIEGLYPGAAGGQLTL
ncbi:MAG TPA: hypothetical protein VEA99_20615 [Gemmatimonadaceae bacterium]|nr:hypothetical protein [Gemmatimonadaceae bacterium]